MFQDPDRQAVYDRWSDDPPGWNQRLVRKFPWGIPPKGGESQGSDMPLESRRKRETSHVDVPMFHANDRTELIRYLKSADASPSWASSHLVRLDLLHGVPCVECRLISIDRDACFQRI